MMEVELTRGYKAVIDAEDFPKVSGISWHVKLYDGVPYAAYNKYLPEQYAQGLPCRKTILMHRLLLGVEDGNVDVDHKDRNTLDNRKQNLRICSRSKNCGNQKRRSTNTSGYKGVYWKKWRKHLPSGTWVAVIQSQHIGYFGTPEQAALAYNTEATKRFGEFALLNAISKT